MARVRPTSQVGVACDLLLAGRATATGIAAQTAHTQERYWKHWCSYCHECNVNPFLDGIPDIEQGFLVTGFAARVRSGAYGHGHRVTVQSVSQALAAISKTCQLARKRSPVYEEAGKYVLQVERCIEGFRREDPPATPQLAVPVAVPEQTARRGQASDSAHQQAIGDLSLIAFYFMLRSGEYTKPRFTRRNGRLVQATRTKQFRIQDIGF